VGLFERTKHLEHLAREIADENLRRLGSRTPVDDEQSRRQVLELESVLREYRLLRDEAEARRQLSAAREQGARENGLRWTENATLARSHGRADLDLQATQRAQIYDREREAARAEADHQAATIARLHAEIATVERRIALLRALRRGATLHPNPPTPGHAPGSNTSKIFVAPRDPLEEAFERLRSEGRPERGPG
jgi:hypothetical protein